MASRVKTVRDELTAALAALAAFTARGITPVAVWAPPEKARDELTTAEVLVAPSGREVALVSRGGLIDERIQMQVAIFDPLVQDAESTTAEADQVLAEAVVDSLVATKLPSGALCVSVNQLSILDVEHWRGKRLFTSVLELEFRL